MSLYRTLIAAVAAIAISAPVFADDTSTSTTGTNDQSTTQAMPASDTSSATQSATDNSAASTEQKVNLNTASAKDLMKVKGLNAAKARAIVAYRKKHGNFKSTDDLANVKGFKKMNADTLKSIQDQLTVE
jgi:competence protein ComEA